MAAHAIVDAGNAVFAMLGNDPGLAVFVTAIAGIALVIPADVAGGAGRVVISIKRKVPAVIESGGLPGTGQMAGGTGRSLPCVQVVTRRQVTGLAFRARFRLQLAMIEFDRAGLGQRRDDGRVLRGAVERLLDRHHVRVIRRLQLAASEGDTLGILFHQRPTPHSPASLQLEIAAAPLSADGQRQLAVRLLKARGSYRQGEVLVRLPG